jgi:hypothetical protein
MNVRDVFNKLKVTIVGTKTTDIDTKLDKAVKDIVAYKTQSGRNGYIELVRSLISKVGAVELTQNFFQTATTPAALGQGSRLLRYKSYDAIVCNINYASRALNVIVDNVLSPDDITKTSLEIKGKKYLEEETEEESKTKRVKEVVEKSKIETKLDIIVKNTLKFGDFFCEIGDAKTALTSKALLTESYSQHKNDLERGIKEKLTIRINEGEKESKDIKIIMDYSSFGDEEKPPPKEEEINLLFYEPKRVVKLQSDMFPLCFGYLVFPEAAISPHLTIQNQIVNSICSTILKSLEKKLPQLGDDIFDDKELKDIIHSMVKETDFSRAMTVRYVSPDKMVHFHVPSTRYYPYGESIFDPTQFTAKVLIALETALTIHRINRSTEKRKITVEIGLPRDARKAIEMLKEEFRKRKFSLDAAGSVDTIPSMITTFEDVYIPQKDGKAYVDISNFNEGMVDSRSKVDELKFMRDSIIASLGVPPSFLGLEENLSNKSALAEENILFARTVINHQKYFGVQITELVRKVLEIIEPGSSIKILDSVTISFPIPRSLQFERESRYMGELAQLVTTLANLGIPAEWSRKKYLPNIDWTEVKKYEVDTKIEKNLGTTTAGDQLGMQGGAIDVGMGGYGGVPGITGPGMPPPVGGLPGL